MTVADAKKAIQEMAKYSQKWHNGTSRERSTETSDGLVAIQAQLNNLGREIKKVNEKVHAAQVGCEQCKGPHYTKDCPLKEKGETLEEAYYTQFGGPFQGGGYRATTPGFMSESTKRHKENSNLIKEIRATTDAAIRNQGASIKTLEIQIGQMSKVLKERGFGSLPSSTETNPRDQVKSISTTTEADSYSIRRSSVSVMPLSTYLNLGLGELAHTKLTVELADRTVKYPKGIAKNVLVGIGIFTFLVDFIILDMPKDIKVPLILGRPFLSTARAKIDVYKRNITLRVGEERIIFISVKPTSSLIKRIYMLSLRERMELDLEARLMGETLVNQGGDVMPTIEEGEVIEKFRTRDEDLDTGIDDYPSYCGDDKKIHIDCAHNLKFSCMIGFEFTHVNFYPLLTFSVMTDFVVLEDMDAYRNEGMGDIIVGEPFLREVGIKKKRLEGIITLYNGDDEVTYQMVRSHPRFKTHTNEQCNKIPPLLKVSEKDVKNGISHAYQKLKGFYKGVLNLGPDYIRNAKTEEWLTRGHISVHEMQ
ncbi:putative reverse transcriptase domain-containing protein [Tanacetum coccineum]